MPKEGLSETGQVVAAIATAVILAVLAKYGFAPDEGSGEGKKSEGGTHHHQQLRRGGGSGGEARKGRHTAANGGTFRTKTI
jgi:hypothetical protein